MSESISENASSNMNPDKGEAYEPLTGRWSRMIAPQFVKWLGIAGHAQWLDVGCGTGAIIQAVLETANPAEVIGIDSSSSFIAYARRQIDDPRVRYEVGDARSLPVPSNQYAAVVSGLVLNSIPAGDLSRSMLEMVRAARAGGVVGAYVWDYADGMELRSRFWQAAADVDSDSAQCDERTRYSICNPDALQRIFERARLNAIETTAFECEARFPSFDDYWLPFLAGYGVASHYLLSLSEDQRQSLREHLRGSLEIADDGSLTLGVRAWGVMGVK